MIKRFLLRLRLRVQQWLAIDHLQNCVQVQQTQIAELRAEVTRLSIAQYVPPQTPEPECKVIQTSTMREFNAILEKEFEHEEA